MSESNIERAERSQREWEEANAAGWHRSPTRPVCQCGYNGGIATCECVGAWERRQDDPEFRQAYLDGIKAREERAR